MDSLALNTFQQAQIAAGSASRSKMDAQPQSIGDFAKTLTSIANENGISAGETANNPDIAPTRRTINGVEYINKKKVDIDPKIKKAAQEFEAVFLSEMLGPVFEKLEADPLFGGGHGEEMYRSMIVQEYGKQLAQNGGIGLQEFIGEQIQEYQKGVTK